jgi:pantetheine-phosphate adenylyltransferase
MTKSSAAGRPIPACPSPRSASNYRLAARRERRPADTKPPAMRLCIYPGTFDPITYGHLDVLERAARLFDHVLVAIAHNPDKGPLFSAEQRLELIRPNIARFANVSVTTFRGLLVDFAMEQHAVAIIRGLRAMSDFESEFNMALMNRHLQPAVETIYVMPNEDYSYTSSHLVKQVSKFGGDVGKFVPANVAGALRAAYGFG